MNNQFVDSINGIVETVDAILMDQMGLIPPEQYDVTKRDGRIYVVGSFDPMMIGRNLKLYENVDTLRVMRKALGGLPIVFTQQKRFTYTILASGKLNLPSSMDFPGFGEPGKFRLGVCLRGEVAPTIQRLKNVAIGANQGAGKSNILKLLVHQARKDNWKLFICDPDGHTFNPDLWNPIANAPVASSSEDLQILIDRIYGEIADRAALFRQVADGGIPPEDLEAFNALTLSLSQRERGREPLPYLGLWVDEINSYLGYKKIQKSLADLLRRGRKWGLHIFLSGHEWHKDIALAELNDMLQTRIGLTVANQETANVVLRSSRWGKWVMGKPTGRGVIRIDQYQPMQFYLVTEEMEREWLSGSVSALSPLPEEEASLVRRSLKEEEGKMSIPLLMGWGMEEREARGLVEEWERRGWLEKDATQKNARFITAKLAGLVSNGQTGQTASNTQMWRQTDVKLSQTPDLAGA